jgi:hypothetical protein
MYAALAALDGGIMYLANHPIQPVPVTEDLFGYALEPPRPPVSASTVCKPKRVRNKPVANATRPKASVQRRFAEPDADEEEDPVPDIEANPYDPPETNVAKRMWRMLCVDLAGTTSTELDLFGDLSAQPDEHGLSPEHRKQDALIWMFDLNPDGADMPFEWVCNEIGLDHEAVRRITARNMRTDLKMVLKLLTKLLSFRHAKDCELRLAEYVNLSGWDLH